jgi:PAS domain S-box-containing protein
MTANESLKYENRQLREKLEEAEELLDAIRNGRVDALVVSGGDQDNVYTLQGADHTYRLLIENMNEGALILGTEGTILYCNRRFGQMLGMPIHKLIGIPIRRLIPAGELPRLNSLLEQLSVHDGLKAEFGLQGSSGRLIPGLISFNSLQLDDMRAVCMVFSDLTEQKAANRELETRADQLRRLTSELTMAEQRERKRVSQLLHDGLQQYLASAKLQLGYIAEQVVGEEVKQAVAEVEEILAESIQMTRSLSTELSPPILHEGGISEGLKWLVRWMRQRHAFMVELHIEEGPDLTDDVKVLCFEAVRELLFNAVKHAGVAEASVHLRPLDPARLQITVSDRGVGFDPGAPAVGTSGKGFGLFSIRERIAFLKGRLEIASAPGEGSCFTLVVPTLQAPPSMPFVPYPEYPASGDQSQFSSKENAIRVLLADDHTLFRDGMARMLEKEPDIEVVGQACDGLQAIELARKLAPHVILMDIGMPRVSGIEATRVIHQEAPQIRIIGLSMYEDHERILVMRNAGASDYRVKDCAVAELLAVVRHPSTRCGCCRHDAAKPT